MRWLAGLLACALVAPAWAGKLDDAEDAVHADHAADADDTESDDDDDSTGDSDGSSEAWSDLLGCGLDLCLPLMIEQIRDDDLAYFMRPPYARGFNGLLLVYPGPTGADAEPALAANAMRRGGVPFAQWLASSYAYDLAGVHRLALSGGLDSTSRFGVQAELAHYVEPQPGHFDKFLVGHAAATFRLVQSPQLVSRAALGVLLHHAAGADLRDVAAGLLLAEDIEAYPWSPLVITGRAEVGWLGEALTVRARAAVGVSVLGWELFAGYDLFGLKGERSSVLLHGPLIGMRAWL